MQINKYKIILLFFCFYFTSTATFFPFFDHAEKKRTITIMLDPAGNAEYTGRIIDNTFERAITLQYAQKLKETAEELFPNVCIVLTRNAGQLVNDLQHAQFANRLNVDLFFSIHFYQETAIKPHIYLYNFSYNDDFITPHKNKFMFYPYDQAHLFHYSRTCQYGSIIKEQLDCDRYKNVFLCAQLIKAPIKPCIGIKAPAVTIEIGLHRADDWQFYIEPILFSLKRIIDSL